MLEVERIARAEEDPVLPALGTEPEPVLSTEGIHVRLQPSRGHELAVDPAVARRIGPAHRRGRDPALPRRNHRDAGSRGILEHHDLRMLAQEGEVVVEGLRRPRH